MSQLRELLEYVRELRRTPSAGPCAALEDEVLASVESLLQDALKQINAADF